MSDLREAGPQIAGARGDIGTDGDQTGGDQTGGCQTDRDKTEGIETSGPRGRSGSGEVVFVHAGFGERAVPYEQAWDLQRRTHERRVRAEVPDTCLLLEHPPVYTAGKRTEPLDRPIGDPGAPVIDVDRGGKITWHGPGQLVGYPIVRLPDPIDVVAYVRRIEEVLMRVCGELGLETIRVEGRSGVWVPGAPERKIAAIGIRVSRGVTMHGFELNCDCDLSWFDRIVPCGIRDAGVTSLTRELGRQVTVAEALALVEVHFADVFGATTAYHRAPRATDAG